MSAARLTVTSPSPRRRLPLPAPRPLTLQCIAPIANTSHTTDTVTSSSSSYYYYVTSSFSPDGSYIALAARHGPIVLFVTNPQSSSRIVRPTPLRIFRGHTADALSLQFASSDVLASASVDRSVRLWHPHTAHCLRRLQHPDMVTSVAFLNHSNLLLTAGCDATLRAFAIDTDGQTDADASFKCPVHAVATSVMPAEPARRCVVGTYDGRLLAVDLDNNNSEKEKEKEKVMVPKILHTPKRRLIQKVTALVNYPSPANHLHVCVAVLDDGDALVVHDAAAVVARLRMRAPSRPVSIGGPSVSPCGAFVLLDAVTNATCIRLADMRPVSISYKHVDNTCNNSSHSNNNSNSSSTSSTSSSSSSSNKNNNNSSSSSSSNMNMKSSSIATSSSTVIANHNGGTLRKKRETKEKDRDKDKDKDKDRQQINVATIAVDVINAPLQAIPNSNSNSNPIVTSDHHDLHINNKGKAKLKANAHNSTSNSNAPTSSALPTDVSVTCAAFAPAAVLRRCGLDDDQSHSDDDSANGNGIGKLSDKGNGALKQRHRRKPAVALNAESTMLVAVGTSDGALRIVKLQC